MEVKERKRPPKKEKIKIPFGEVEQEKPKREKKVRGEDILVKSFKYKVECKEKSIKEMEKILEYCKDLYNSAILQKRIAYYSVHSVPGELNVTVRERKNISFEDQAYELFDIKQYFPEMYNYPSSIFNKTLRRVDKTFSNFFSVFKKIKENPNSGTISYPKYKDSYKTIEICYVSGWFIGNQSSFKLHNGSYDQKIDHNILWVNGIGRLKMLGYEKRPIIGKPVQLSLTLDNGTLWAIITVDYKKQNNSPITRKFVGLDVGINHLISDSDRKQWDILRNKIEDPLYKFYNEYKKENKILQRKRSKYEKNNQIVPEKLKLKINKLESKIFNMKKHYYYNIVKYYIDNYDIIVMEDLSIKNMSTSVRGTIENPGKNVAQKTGLNRSILEQSWYLLRSIMENKCKETGRKFIVVPPKNTTKQCSNIVCGKLIEKSLSTRTHCCPYCGLIEDRDINAAHNILREGLNLLQKQVV